MGAGRRLVCRRRAADPRADAVGAAAAGARHPRHRPQSLPLPFARLPVLISPTMNAVSASREQIEKVLGKSPAFRKVEEDLYVVKQGSSYVMISVNATGPKSKHN